MTKRRLLRWSLILLIFAAFAVWLEPTRVVWGWLRGEAFYHGRPTSWWREELDKWYYMQYASFHGGTTRYGAKDWYREPNFFQRQFPQHFQRNDRHIPLLDGDPDSQGVLLELLQYPGPNEDLELESRPRFNVIAEEGLRNIQEKQRARR
jgi:hypothetical protein